MQTPLRPTALTLLLSPKLHTKPFFPVLTNATLVLLLLSSSSADGAGEETALENQGTNLGPITPVKCLVQYLI